MGDRLTKDSPKILQRNSPESQEMGRSIPTDRVRGPGSQGGMVQSSQTPSAPGTLLPCQQPCRSNTLKMAPAACGARRLPCYFPRCPRCQEKPIIRNAISYIYLSLSPPASSSRLPARPCGAPLTQWAHFPVVDARDHLPKPRSPALSPRTPAIRPAHGHDDLLRWYVRARPPALPYAPDRQALGWWFQSQTEGRQGWVPLAPFQA